MLNKYECEKCGSTCYIEGELWTSCPICEETHTERKIKMRAAVAEQKRDHYAALLGLAARFAEENLESQIRTQDGEVWDGLYLMAYIENVLEGRE